MYDWFNWNFWVVQGSGGRFAVSIRNSSVVFIQILCVMFVLFPGCSWNFYLILWYTDSFSNTNLRKQNNLMKLLLSKILTYFFFLWNKTAEKSPIHQDVEVLQRQSFVWSEAGGQYYYKFGSLDVWTIIFHPLKNEKAEERLFFRIQKQACLAICKYPVN